MKNEKTPRKPLVSVRKKDFDIDWFSGKGAGGQHRNKHQNCCRLTHKDSGVMATGQNHRSQEMNLKDAFKAIIASPKFQSWLKLESSRAMGIEILEKEDIERKVEESMDEKNLLIEYLGEDK